MEKNLNKSLCFAMVEKLWLLGLISDEELSKIKENIEINLQKVLA